MYLKSLEVHGFKSFANKLVFEFHNGITAIVGPNGSGKSNVADAMRWVLGEQSAKQLRGAKMEDVIFAGTQMRKPLGYAYVAVTINNEDQKLSVPYNEVKIARRVYRSGESEYFLNGTQCRLRDVQELLFDTGIGKEGYSIIGQGQIDRILSSKPEERRELFDEAAGIVKYKKRKAAAEKNLEEEKQNLVRIEDILSELSRQILPLERQAAKAKEYLKYRDELRSLDVNMFLIEYQRTDSELEDVCNKIEIAVNDLEKAKSGFNESKQKYVELEEQLNNLNYSIDSNSTDLSARKVQLNDYENDIKVLNEQINAIHQSEKHYKEQIEGFKSRREILDKELKDYSTKANENNSELERLHAEKKENEDRLSNLLEKADVNEKEIEKCRNSIMESVREASETKAEQNRLETLLEQSNIKKAEFAQRIIKNKSDASLFTEIMEREEKSLKDISEEIALKEIEDKELKQKVEKLESDSEGLQVEYREAEKQFHIENSRLASLKNMAERYEGFGQSTRRIMEQKDKHSGIIGVVADIIKVKKEYETAVETALGGSIQNIVTDNAQTAKEMIQFLKQNKYGRATFLPLTDIKARREVNSDDIMAQKGVIGVAASLVETENRFKELVKYLLGGFVVVDNIDNAIVLARKYSHTIRIVTIEGDLLSPGGSMSGGAFKNSTNLLGRKRETESFERSVKELKEKLSELSSLLETVENEKASILKEVTVNEKAIQELILKQNTSKINYDRALSDFKANEEKLAHIHLEAKAATSKNAELLQALEQINVKLKDNADKNKSYEDKIVLLNNQLQELHSFEEDINKKTSSIILKITSLEGRQNFISENTSRINQEIKDVENELAKASENSKNIDVHIAKKHQEIEDVNAEIKKSGHEIKSLEEVLEQKKKEREELSKRHRECLLQRDEMSDLINRLDKECFRLNSQKEKLDGRINSYTDYMWEQYELTYHSAKDLKTETSLSFDNMKKRINELKSSIKLLGDVNINAVEQYNELMERHNLLTEQHEDLMEASEVLVGIIEELDTEMRKQFEIQFEGINKRFDYVFKELFGGGRGTIELVDGEDILVAGINIIAQPPGKKLQNMMQLSGGEKALAAIALLFAIQSLKPSPFCLLDEIEAALDDSNVGRFADYLHKLSEDTQFIVITHRRGTMNAADILYGITMQEKGVSTLVSVNLMDADDSEGGVK